MWTRKKIPTTNKKSEGIKFPYEMFSKLLSSRHKNIFGDGFRGRVGFYQVTTDRGREKFSDEYNWKVSGLFRSDGKDALDAICKQIPRLELIEKNKRSLDKRKKRQRRETTLGKWNEREGKQN